MPTDVIAAFVGVFAGLQALSLLLQHLNIAARKIEGRSTWTAPDGTVFEEFSLTELEGSEIMRREFETSRAEGIVARHFGDVRSNS